MYFFGGILAIAISLTIFYQPSVSGSGFFADIDKIRKFTWFIPIVLAFLSYICIIIFIVEYINIKKKLPLKEYKTVEGKVQNFFSNSMYKVESFDINGVEFEYNGKWLLNGYCQLKNSGGVVTHNGQN